MVDGRQSSAAILLRRGGWLELDVPDLAKLAGRVEEINQAAAHPPHRRNLQFAGADLLAEWRIAQLLGAIERRRSALHLQADGGNGRPVCDIMRMGETFLF